MSNINLDRYHESLNIMERDKCQSKLQNSAHASLRRFIEKYENEYLKNSKVWLAVYESDVPYNERSKMLRLVERSYSPQYLRPVEYFFANLGNAFVHWLICGPNWHYDKMSKHWGWIDGYHLLTKLCRYETWKDVRINAWDRLRFRLVTGYKFEQNAYPEFTGPQFDDD